MKAKNYLKSVALFLAVLVISLPITFAQQINYVTDANGNLVTGDSFYREYNELNQLIRVRQGNASTGPILEEYIWHPLEERILVKDVFSNGVLNYSVYYVNKNYIHIENSSGNYSEKYVYQDGVLVAQVDTNGNKHAVHSDHEGSNTLLTDSAGNVVENTFYSPYGEILEGGKASRFDYEGKEFDSAVQDYDFHFRKYKPDVPLFNQPDTLISNVYDPQFLNRYAFERNNPYKYTDPDGHIELVTTVVIIGIAIFVLEGYQILYDAQADYNRKEINAIKTIANENVGTPKGIFNTEYASVLGSQNTLSDKLLLKSTFSYDKKQISSSEKDYIKNMIEPLLSDIDVEDTPTTASEILDLLQQERENLGNDPTFQSIKKKFEVYEMNYQQVTDKSKEVSKNQNNKGGGGGGGSGCRTCNLWDDLRKEAEEGKKRGETAGDIIRRWRGKYK